MAYIRSFGYYGGKFSHLEWLLPLLPACHHYVEPFAGSASVLLNRDPSPLETYNDADGEIVNFFSVLRDQPEKLMRALLLTPHSRIEFYKAIDVKGSTPLERARTFFIRVSQSRHTIPNPQKTQFSVITGKGDNAQARAKTTNNIASKLLSVARRLRNVQFENRDVSNMLTRFNESGVLLYCDPPYHPATRKSNRNEYVHELSEDAYAKFVSLASASKARVAISGYAHPEVDKLFVGWHKTLAPEKIAATSLEKRQEVLWTNYPPIAPRKLF